MLAYGYRVGEVPLPPLGAIKQSVRFSPVSETDPQRRTPVNVSLGCHLQGYCEPEPDPYDPMTVAAGVCKRFGVAPPPFVAAKLERLRSFVRRFVRSNFSPLPYDSDVSLETWLESCPYPAWRKEELKKVWEERGRGLVREDYCCKSFVKDETYPEYKHARGINSRTDAFKCCVGPIFKLIEKVVFQYDAFIKKVPVSKRPDYIMDMLYSVGAEYSQTDYTAFESLFVKEVMEACEFELYDWMTSQLPDHDWFMGLCHDVLAGENVCKFKYFSVILQATRMSGEMCTSLGNGFSNLMFMLFLCEEVGSRSVIGVVEGDDGLFAISGPAPKKSDFESLGLIIKLETHAAIAEASFCGIIFDPDDRCNIRDPLRVLTGFGWTSRAYVNCKGRKFKALLRCKALSLMYQYPGCPIIQALAEYGLRVTTGVTHYDLIHVVGGKAVNEYQREILFKAIETPVKPTRIGMGSRLLVERMFRIPVEDQIRYENYLSGLSSIQPLTAGVLDPIMPRVWADYDRNYVVPLPSSVFYPGLPCRQQWYSSEVCSLTGWVK